MYEVLSAADLYMLPRLKRHCAGVICRYLAPDNVVSILRLARLFNLARLEDQCAEVMSMYIDKVFNTFNLNPQLFGGSQNFLLPIDKFSR